MTKVAVVSCCDYDSLSVNNSLTELMAMLGYDFSDFIKPGMTVFIKPNWVASRWRESCPHKDTLYSVITHPAVIEALADRVAIALNGNGKIIIGDNPSIDVDFEELTRFTGIRRLADKYDVPCDILDLRPLVCKNLDDYGNKSKMHEQSGDPNGTVEINLGNKSLLYNVDSSLFRGVFDDRNDTVLSHTGDTQLYTFSKSLYESDVYISVPKLKTHHKVGVTLNLKGLVGSIAKKNQLVHWRLGCPETGGDEYPNKDSLLKAENQKIKSRGSHPQNDTIWRMVVDLYNAIRTKPRKYFSVIDGICAGERNGPFCPREKKANVLISGNNLLATDIVATRLMGFNPNKIKYLNHFIENRDISLSDIDVMSNLINTENFFNSSSSYLGFRAPDGWEWIKATNL